MYVSLPIFVNKKRAKFKAGETRKQGLCDEKALGSAWLRNRGKDAFLGHSC